MAHADNSIITGKFRDSPGEQLVFRQAETQERFLADSRYALPVTNMGGGVRMTRAKCGHEQGKQESSKTIAK